jgi:hypothetical protein
VFADDGLAQRIGEHLRAMSRLTAEAVERLHPDWAPTFLALPRTHGIYAGIGSPLTKAEGAYQDGDLEALSQFYCGRTRTWEAAISPYAADGAVQRVISAGGEFMGWENVMFRDLNEPLRPLELPDQLRIERVEGALLDTWSDVSTRGFFGESSDPVTVELADMMREIEGMERYLAYWNDQPAAAANYIACEGVASLGGAATLPEYRSHGLQGALIVRRLIDARAHADLALLGATPGSGSQRNAERAGFGIAYTLMTFSMRC